MQTENVLVKYVPKSFVMDGIRCDITVGFGQQSRIVTGKKERYDLYDEKQIAKYIVEEETR